MAVPLLSVVIPTHDTRELTLRCLSSLAGGGAPVVEVVVVDDASSDGTAAAVRAGHVEALVVSTRENVGFSRAANLGVDKASGDVVLVLNSDTEVLDGALAAVTAAFAADDRLGIAGAELLDPDGTPQWRAGRWPTPAWLFALSSGLGAAGGRLPWRSRGQSGATAVGEVDWVSGAALAFRREVWTECGPFDTGYRFYCQDLDLCRSARRAGWSVAVVPGFGVLHHHGASIGRSVGASGAVQPAHLWSDLVRYTAKTDGATAARRAVAALAAGARVRLAGRALGRVLASDRGAWDRDTEAFREALTAIRR